jgi:hypothetical protein
MSKPMKYPRRHGRPLCDGPPRGAGRIRDVGKSHELIEFVRHYDGSNRFMRSLRIDAFDDSWTPTKKQAVVVRQIMAEEAARAAQVGHSPQTGLRVLVTEVTTLTNEQVAVLRFLDEYRGDPHPYVLGMQAKAKRPGWVPSKDNVTWCHRRAPELFESAFVDRAALPETIANPVLVA